MKNGHTRAQVRFQQNDVYLHGHVTLTTKMAAGQQWVLVEMVQAFYEVGTKFSARQFSSDFAFCVFIRLKP